MRIGFSSGWTENFWAGWPWSKQMGGSEHMLVEVACELASSGHEVVVRLPYQRDEVEWRGVRWVGLDAPASRYDALFCFDDFSRRDTADRVALVATRSDPPVHQDFDELIFFSRSHAKAMGHPDRPFIGGGVSMADYMGRGPTRRPRLVIYTSSPDRGGHHAAKIGQGFDFVATYRGQAEMTVDEVVMLQRAATVQIHPCDPARPAEWFCMSILEALAAGTPCVISDADALPEMYAEVATVLPRPIVYGAWWAEVEDLCADRSRWANESSRGRLFAAQYDWRVQAPRYLKALGVG